MLLVRMTFSVLSIIYRLVLGGRDLWSLPPIVSCALLSYY